MKRTRKRQPPPEPVQENSNSGYSEVHPLPNGIEEPLEAYSHEPGPDPDSETKTEELQPAVREKNLKELEKSTSTTAEPISLPQEAPKLRD